MKSDHNQANSIPELTPTQLRWSCPESWLGFNTTAELDPLNTPLPVTDSVQEALSFGILNQSPGQNVFLRGIDGCGRHRLFLQALERHRPKATQLLDRCFVHNFSQPDRPVLLSLPAGSGKTFRRAMKRLSQTIAELPKAVQTEPFQSQLASKQQEISAKINAVLGPFEKELVSVGLVLAPMKTGEQVRTVILPIIDGQAVQPQDFEQRVQEGKISPEQRDQFFAKLQPYQQSFAQIQQQINAINEAGSHELQSLSESLTIEYLKQATAVVLQSFDDAKVAKHLDHLIEDVVDNLANLMQGKFEVESRYGVNLLQSREVGMQAPVVVESSPSLLNLLGSVEPVFTDQGMVADYRGVRGGSLLRADGGFLLISVNDLMREPGAYPAMIRTQRSRCLDIIPTGGPGQSAMMLKPESINLDVKVVLIGDANAFYQLSSQDPDFARLFKVLIDVDSTLKRSPEAVLRYGLRVAQMVKEEQLPDFSGKAVAALVEHGARIASSGGKISARLARVVDIAREAAFLCQQAEQSLVSAEHVKQAIQRAKSRAGLPTEHFNEMRRRGAIIIKTEGSVVGQINGLAVMQTGVLSYGFPSRITATVGVGRAGLIDIEGQADMSGSIHTKGFQILGGLLRHLLKTDHPLAFSASIAFEQSYGGIDGDSASGAETCCFLSALTGIPVRQDMAMTGAIDQKGSLQVIGGANEKIEGFFDACVNAGLSGTQGVVIPGPNADDLMLREDVVQAVEAGKFHIYAVDTIYDAISIMLATPAGVYSGVAYPEGSVLALARDKARHYYVKSKASLE